MDELTENLKESRDTGHALFGMCVTRRLALAIINLYLPNLSSPG